METYLREFEQSLRLDPEDTRAILVEVRGNLEDLIAHLREQGYPPADAEEEAVRRFDDAGGLARALRRVHRRAPLPLRALALLIGLSGLSGLALTVSIVQTLMAANAHRIHSGVLDVEWPNPANPATPGFGRVIVVTLTNLLPILIVALVAVASVSVAIRILRGRRRGRWRKLGIGATLIALVDGALLAVVATTIPRGGATPDALPALVPNARALVAAGLSGRPAAGQPQRPATVDLVLVDDTGTFVQYHIPDAPHDGEPALTLVDDANRPYTQTTGSSSFRPIDQILPWRPAVPYLDQFAPLRPDAHAAVLRFSVAGRVVETVRVPLHLAALRGAGRVSHPNVSDTLHGIRATVVEVTRGIAVSHLTYTVEVPRALAGPGQGVIFENETVTDAHGRHLDGMIGTWQTHCLPWPPRRGHCTWTTTGYPFASAPPGTRVTLRLSGLELDGPGGHMRPIRGAWRLPFTMP